MARSSPTRTSRKSPNRDVLGQTRRHAAHIPIHIPEQAKDRHKVLVLQGGGALGAYQAGAFEALADSGLSPDWVAGISIGSINCALIAGNPPEKRVAALRDFWEKTSMATASLPFVPTGIARGPWNSASSLEAMMFGVPGFFRPRMPSAWITKFTDPTKISYYDTAPLRDTLERLVDFDLLNDGPVRVSLGAVNIETGNLTYFDSEDTILTPDHVMASGALPPGFPPIEIDGALYWDGGLVSNAPLQYVLEDGLQLSCAQGNCPPLLIYQVDLFPASGEAPATLAGIETREKDIRFSSRTRATTDRMKDLSRVSELARRLAAKLPPELRDDPDLRLLMDAAANSDVTVIHLIYRHFAYENGSKDYEFSRPSMLEHWQAGSRDVQRSHANADWETLLAPGEGMKAFDLSLR
ncbi:patatin-like phospholipase family protein [uncultured Thioclava sp.]|uniref:patatin-like phospholipase family protein n=1 Tax=uncultured Thioclava sp. TaxID=473858 RepID=UPI0025F4FFE0|nr:patatin-like phospholipase family protein [uncultured Thioclava sp.]